MDKKNIVIVIVFLIILSATLGLLLFSSDKSLNNTPPEVEIMYPTNLETVSGIVQISGAAFDKDTPIDLCEVQIKINGAWHNADGFSIWSYEWNTFEFENNEYTISVRAYDGIDYSKVKKITVTVDNPDIVESDNYKWAVFVASANAVEDTEKKLGNGGLFLAEEMASYFIEKLGYSTSNIFILFDDGWIRSNNGLGPRVQTLQQRNYRYNINYGSATTNTVTAVINHVKEKSNKFEDSEVFLWFFGHGWGDSNRGHTGGKVLQRSALMLWDEMLYDKELGSLLSDLNSQKTCIIVDACFSGGFADKTIFDFPEFFLFQSNIMKPGRVVITGSSKFRVAWASTIIGPLFTNLWFEGLRTGAADGFRSSVLNRGRKPITDIFKDGEVSVQEAFYYARFTLRTESDLADYSYMQPQINDMYPRRGLIASRKELVLG